jgi:hypothetical protein
MNYVLEFRPEVRKELDDAYNWYENQQTGHKSTVSLG